MTIASLRILRLALGTGLSLLVSQIYAWDLSFIAPVITMLVLALPKPVPGLKGGIALVLALGIALNLGVLFLPMLLEQPAAGLLLLILALFWSFYFTAKGGPMAVGSLATIGIALSIGVGSVSLDAVFLLISSLLLGAVVGVLFVWLAHAILPNSMAETGQATLSTNAPAKEQQAPSLLAARWSATRSTLIVLPIILWFLFSSASAAYVPVLIKVAAMGQQAGSDGTRDAGRSLIMSTLIGGLGAIVGWQMLSVVPTLAMYTLFVALAGLVMGRRIFQGAGLHPDGATWSYAYLTMIVILAPAVMDGMGGAPAGAKFWERLVMFGLATLYAVLAVTVFDAFRPRGDRAEADAPRIEN